MRCVFLLACTTSVFGLSNAAIAQEAADSTDNTEAQAGVSATLDEIIVQARRRNERLQDVPVSVAVATPEQMQRNNITNIADVSRINPSLVATPGLTSGRSYPVFAIRGQSQQEFTLLADPSVPVYIGDVVAARMQGVNGAVFDVAAVEVLRGPQGTLFGRNSTGGAIVIRPNKPTDEFEGEVGITLGSRNMVNVDAMVNVPLSDSFQLRVAGAQKKDDGYVYDEILRENVNETDQQAARVSLRYASPTSSFESVTMYDYFRANDGGIGAFLDDIVEPPLSFYRTTDAYGAPRNYTSFTTLLAEQKARGPYRIAVGIDTFSKVKTHTVQNSTSMDLNDWLSVKNIVGYRHVRSAAVDDYDGTSNPVQQSERHDYTKQFTEEFQLFGEAGPVKYIAGAYYFWERGRNQGLSAAAVDPGDLESGFIREYPVLSPSDLSNTDVAATNESYAFFGQVDVQLTDAFSVTGGIRFNTDRRSIIARNRNIQGEDPNSGFACRFSRDLDNDPSTPETPRGSVTEEQCIVEAKASFSKPTYNISAQYKLSPDVLIYAAHRHGYRTGGFAARASTESGLRQTFNPEFIDDVELGLKSDLYLGDMFVRTNLAGYYSWYKDLQRALSVAPTGGGPITTAAINIGKARIWGIEADFLARPTQQIEFTANYAYTNAKYVEYLVVNPSNGSITDRTDDPFARAPRNVYTIGARFTPDISTNLGEFSIGANVFHTDGYSGLEDYQEGYVEVEGYELVNADVSLNGIAGSDVDLRLFVTNLLDKEYQFKAFPAVLGYSVDSAGTPRTIGVSVRAHF